MSCEQSMEQMSKDIAGLRAHFSGLVDSLYAGTNEPWEKPEILTFGGPAGDYNIQAPFVGDCQYSVQSISTSIASVVQISPKIIPSQAFSFATSPRYSGMSSYNGFIFNAAATQTPVPVMSEWTYLSNSNNTLFMRIDIAASNAAYVAVCFRQKRVAGHER